MRSPSGVMSIASWRASSASCRVAAHRIADLLRGLLEGLLLALLQLGAQLGLGRLALGIGRPAAVAAADPAAVAATVSARRERRSAPAAAAASGGGLPPPDRGSVFFASSRCGRGWAMTSDLIFLGLIDNRLLADRHLRRAAIGHHRALDERRASAERLASAG